MNFNTALLVGMLTIIYASATPSFSQSHSARKSFAAINGPQLKSLCIRLEYGEVQLVGTDQDSIEMVIFSSKSINLINQFIGKQEGLPTYSTKTNAVSYYEGTNAIDLHSYSEYIEKCIVKIPFDLNVEAHIFVGPDAIELHNLSGNLNIGVGHGPIIGRGLSGSVQATIFSYSGENIDIQYRQIPNNSVHYYSNYGGNIMLSMPKKLDAVIYTTIGEGRELSIPSHWMASKYGSEKVKHRNADSRKFEIGSGSAEINLVTLWGNIKLQSNN